MTEKLLTLKEAAESLGLSEAEVRRLVEKEVIPAYQIGGRYLRFKKEQVLQLKVKYPKDSGDSSGKRRKNTPADKEPLLSKVGDFLYFNDFYIISAATIAALVYIILNSIR